MTSRQISLAVCHRCQKKEWGHHVATCKGVDIVRRAESGKCPHNLFPPASATCQRCWSCNHAVADCPIPPGYTPGADDDRRCGCA